MSKYARVIDRFCAYTLYIAIVFACCILQLTGFNQTMLPNPRVELIEWRMTA